MKTRFIYLLPLALLLWGCLTKSEEDPEPEKKCLLQQIMSDGFSQRYTYNSQDQLISIAVDSAGVPYGNITLTYDSKNRAVKVASPHTLLVNEYNEQDQLIKQTRSYRGAAGATYTEYDYYTISYNSKKELEEAHYYLTDSGSGQLYGIWKYTYTNGDPTLIVHSSPQGKEYSRTELTFDDKLSPRYALNLEFNPEVSPSVHNITSYRRTERINDVWSYNTSYTYNKQNLPTVATTTYPGGDKWTTTYTYSCQ